MDELKDIIKKTATPAREKKDDDDEKVVSSK